MSQANQSTKAWGWTACGVVGLALVLTAVSGTALGSVSGPYVLEMAVSNAAGTETCQYNVPIGMLRTDDEEPGMHSWSLPTEIVLTSTQSGVELATVKGLSVEYWDDPQVRLNFNVIAGAADTSFTINSSKVAIGLTNPYAYASASVTLTDGIAGGGATLTGQYAGGMMYEARYNDGASKYTNLLVCNPLTAPANFTSTLSDRYPGPVSSTDRTVIGGSVTNAQAQVSFLLSAGDQANGTSRFDVSATPEPATLALLALGGLVMRSRRRS